MPNDALTNTFWTFVVDINHWVAKFVVRETFQSQERANLIKVGTIIAIKIGLHCDIFPRLVFILLNRKFISSIWFLSLVSRFMNFFFSSSKTFTYVVHCFLSLVYCNFSLFNFFSMDLWKSSSGLILAMILMYGFDMKLNDR